MSTLLEKARGKKSRRKHTKVTEEHIELALAWAKNEVQFSQVQHALDQSYTSATYISLACALAEYIRRTGVEDKVNNLRNLP